MPKGMTDLIVSILKKYERDPAKNEKKAVLLMPQGGYFLYGNRFCSISDYELEFQSDSCRIHGNAVQVPIFLGVLQDGLHAVGEMRYSPEFVNLIFHIDLEEDEILRGILLSAGGKVRFVLFCDEAIEELYRLSRETGIPPGPRAAPDENLQQYAESLRRNDLHGLTELYLHGKSIQSMFVENP